MQTARFLGVLLPLIVACGPSVGEAPSQLTAACENLQAQRAGYDARCNGIAPDATQTAPYVDACVGIATAPGATLASADIDACAAQLAAACVPRVTYPACVGYGGNLLYPGHDLPGSRAAGESCFADVQCASAYCGAVGDACGACQRVRKLGESCAGASDLCVDPETSCLDGTCQYPGKKLGEDCIDYPGVDCQKTLFCANPAPGDQGKCVARAGAGATCTDPRACADGLTCTAGACAALGAPGAACDHVNGCAASLFCDAGACAALRPDGAACEDGTGCASGGCAAGVCRALRAGLVEGQDCTVDECRRDLICTEGDVCANPATIPAGGACGDDAAPAPGTWCAPGLYCRVVCPAGDCAPGTCTALPQAGERCTPVDSCALGAECQGFDATDLGKGRCVALGLEGGACPCSDQLACIGGACVAYGAAVCD